MRKRHNPSTELAITTRGQLALVADQTMIFAGSLLQLDELIGAAQATSGQANALRYLDVLETVTAACDRSPNLSSSTARISTAPFLATTQQNLVGNTGGTQADLAALRIQARRKVIG